MSIQEYFTAKSYVLSVIICI